MGTDGHQLLWAVYDASTPAWLRDLLAIQTLRQVWLPRFYATPHDQPVRWRGADDLSPALLLISFPYDPESRYGPGSRGSGRVRGFFTRTGFTPI